MRITPLIVIAFIVAPSALAAAGAEADAPASSTLAHDAQHALALLRDALFADDANATADAVAFAEARVFNESTVPARAAVNAWQANGDDADAPVRARLLTAEAALLALASANVRQALDAGDVEAARAWLAIPHARALGDARGIPLAPADAPESEALVEALDAALAARAREAVVTALLLHHAEMPAAAESAANGAAALARVAVDAAAHRLPDALAAPLRENATRVPDVVRALPLSRDAFQATGLLAPLVAIEYDRDVEKLDEFAIRNVDAAYAVARAAEEDPVLLRVMAQSAIAQYAADRGGLYMRGEGTLEAVDAAYQALDAAVLDERPEPVLAAARDVHAALRPVGLLERGIVLKVETGGVQPERVHAYRVTLVRPPLEGIHAYTLQLTFDPDVVRVLDFVSRLDDVDVTFSNPSPGVVIVEGGAREGTGIARSAILGHLRLEAAGPAGAGTELTIADARFVEPDGDAAEVFRLRDGSATVAVIEREDPADVADAAVPADAAPARTVPAGPVVFGGFALLAAAAALRRRRA